ncbi:MAG: DUF2628 domain-containing protein [Nitrospinae bacterium]|nr:DUF2628 domain-containing protein [Nitrospinota bacterium]
MSEEIRTKAADEKFCETCGAAIKIAAEICPKCGVRQKNAPQAEDAGKKALEQAIPGYSLLKPYYQVEFKKIFESKGVYTGKWNWASCFGFWGWALWKGLWLNGIIWLVVVVASGGALTLIAGIYYGIRGNQLYYKLLTTNKQPWI